MRKLLILLLANLAISPVFAVNRVTTKRKKDEVNLATPTAVKGDSLTDAPPIASKEDEFPVVPDNISFNQSEQFSGASDELDSQVAKHALPGVKDPFQVLDNQYNFAYGFQWMTLSNGNNKKIQVNNQVAVLDVERLFKNHIWLDATANIVLTTTQKNNSATGTGVGDYMTPATQNPNLGGVNVKLGYAFTNILPNQLLLTPYATVGRNTNAAMSTILANSYSNITHDYFYTLGGGARVEYLISPQWSLYADEVLAYSLDQSKPISPYKNADMFNSTTLFGAKYLPYKDLIIGFSGFYSYFNQRAQPSTAFVNGGPDSSGSGNFTTAYKPSYQLGFYVSAGLTY